MSDRRFVTFACTGRGHHKVRRLRRFRWEPVDETLSAVRGERVDGFDVEARDDELERLVDLQAAGTTHHLVEDDRVREVDGTPMSHLGDLSRHVANNVGELRHGTYTLSCPTCKRNVPLQASRLGDIVKASMIGGLWQFDISGIA